MTDQPKTIDVPATATDAQTQLNTLTGDAAWTARFVNGDPAAKRDFEALTTVATGGSSSAEDVVTSVMSGKGPQPGNSAERQMVGVVEAFRDLGIRDEVTQEFLSGKQVTPEAYQLVAGWKKESMGSADFVKRFLAGDVKAKQQMTIANTVLVNGIKSEA